MTQVKAEGLRTPQEPVIKMTSEVGMQEIDAILGEGKKSRLADGSYVLGYPAIAVGIVFGIPDLDLPPVLTSLRIGDREVMQLKNAGIVLDMGDGSVTFVEKTFGDTVKGIAGYTLSTKLKKVDYFDRDVDSVPAESKDAYFVKAANRALDQFKKRAVG